MRVVTLRQEEFEQSCRQLAKEVGLSYSPDVIVGILTGGGYIGKLFFDELNGDGTKKYFEVEAHRPGYNTKQNSAVKAMLMMMPRVVLDWARILESKVLEHRYKSRKEIVKREIRVNVPDDVREMLTHGGCKILIVDDAIDSGVTMASVMDFFAREFPDNAIKTAVITVTTATPTVDADYSLYNDHVLVRFPWSQDMKQ